MANRWYRLYPIGVFDVSPDKEHRGFLLKDILYARIDITMAENPKIAILSDAAFRGLVEMILWSRQQLTDGRIPSRYALKRWTFEVLQELMSNDDARPSVADVGNGYQIHDFTDYQTEADAVRRLQEKRRDAGRKGGIASGLTRSKPEAKRSKTKPLPALIEANASKMNPETETETETEIKDTHRGTCASAEPAMDLDRWS